MHGDRPLSLLLAHPVLYRVLHKGLHQHGFDGGPFGIQTVINLHHKVEAPIPQPLLQGQVALQRLHLIGHAHCGSRRLFKCTPKEPVIAHQQTRRLLGPALSQPQLDAAHGIAQEVLVDAGPKYLLAQHGIVALPIRLVSLELGLPAFIDQEADEQKTECAASRREPTLPQLFLSKVVCLYQHFFPARGGGLKRTLQDGLTRSAVIGDVPESEVLDQRRKCLLPLP